MNWGEGDPRGVDWKIDPVVGGGLVLGYLTGESGYERIEPLFGGLFTGILTLFLLEWALLLVANCQIKKAGLAGRVRPCFPASVGTLGVLVGHLTGMGNWRCCGFGCSGASASYIAAPAAAVRLALPEASPGLYLTASLGITFPFNLIIGIPLLLALNGYGRNGAVILKQRKCLTVVVEAALEQRLIRTFSAWEPRALHRLARTHGQGPRNQRTGISRVATSGLKQF